MALRLHQAHHQPFADDEIGMVRIRVLGLQDVGGKRGTRRLRQRTILQDDGQPVLRTGQQHALGGGVRHQALALDKKSLRARGFLWVRCD
ncbi:MAG: hypothetical protein J0I00_14660 [Burkholderiales bacterium]|nr:hypothetical protein [Burkholderiales bacterium]